MQSLKSLSTKTVSHTLRQYHHSVAKAAKAVHQLLQERLILPSCVPDLLAQTSKWPMIQDAYMRCINIERKILAIGDEIQAVIDPFKKETHPDHPGLSALMVEYAESRRIHNNLLQEEFTEEERGRIHFSFCFSKDTIYIVW